MPPSDPFWWVPALKTLAVLAVLAAAYWPWTTRLCRGIPDRGAGLAIAGGVFGFLLTARVAWMAGIMPPRTPWLWMAVGAAGLAGWRLCPRFRGSAGARARMRASARRGAWVFVGLFAFWIGIRSADPGIEHTEQPMDLMWMRAAMAAETPPIRDAWFGNAPATYYADGHQALAFLSALTGEPVSTGYNLTQAVWFALTGLLVFQTTPLLLPGRRFRYGAGALAVPLVLFLSTVPGFRDALTGEPDTWWWWNASRILPEAGDSLITEFPFFSFWLGDNHAHVIGLPVLILAVAASRQLARARRLDAGIALPAGLAVAWSAGINPWQAPTALALVGIGLLSRTRLPSPREGLCTVAGLLTPLALLWPGGPGMFQGIAFDLPGHTTPLDALRVFGWMVPGVIGCLFLPRSRWGVGLAILCAGLFASCELVRVVDVFQNRMNTVFKIYYQLWPLLGMAAAAGWMAALRTRWRPLALASLALPALGMVYAARLSGSALAPTSRSLDALTAELPTVRARLRIADRLIRPGDRIAEAPGESYHPGHNRLGTWTAGASLLGWKGHQTQWRPDTPHPFFANIYTAPTPAALRHALVEHDVQWVWLGSRERRMFPVHRDVPRWLDRDHDRVIDQPDGALWEIRGEIRPRR